MPTQGDHRGFDTLAVHAGQKADPTTGARAVPIYQTTSFVFRDTEHAADMFALRQDGNIYTRLGNPTCEVLEQRMAALEGGVGALVTASGLAAETLAILNLAGAGDHVVSSCQLYGGTYNLLRYTLARLGIETTFVEPSEPEEFARALRDNTRAVYAESLGNPKSDMLDIAAVAQVAHEHCVPLIVDNTVTTPYLLRPIECGADIVVHSLTKFLAGHGTSLGGVIVDSGNFDWGSGRFPHLTEPDASYRGLSFHDTFGNRAYIVKARSQLLRDLGPALSPFNAFLILQGIETLPLRMRRHCDNALTVAEHLQAHPTVSWVSYPGLPDHTTHELARQYLRHGYGGIVGFGIKGGSAAGRRFLNSVRLLSHQTSIGDAKSLVCHPASTTHSELQPEELAGSGVTEDFIRLAVGIEDVDDIIADIDQALAASQG